MSSACVRALNLRLISLVLVEEEKKRDRIEKKTKQTYLHKDQAFNTAQIKPTQKYEYPFLGRNEVYTHTFLLSDDPYDSTKDERLRAKWIEEA